MVEASTVKRWALRVFLVVGSLVVAAMWVYAIVVAVLPPAVPEPTARPAASYADATKRITALKARDDASIAYGTLFLGQGSRVTTSVVIFHGYTNNPKQFERIARDLHTAGYNVLVPRLPGHGKADILNDALSESTPDALVMAIDEAVDIAAGLGEHVEVVGLSGGGTMALWAAYNRDEVDRVVSIAPLMLPLSLPTFVVKPITVIARVIPDIHLWWDPRVKDRNNIPPHRYPRYSIRSLASLLDLSFDISDSPSRRSARIPDSVLVLNEADQAIDLRYAKRVFERKIEERSAAAEEIVFDKDKDYAHDLIDPLGMNARNIDEIYARLYPVLGMPPAAARP